MMKIIELHQNLIIIRMHQRKLPQLRTLTTLILMIIKANKARIAKTKAKLNRSIINCLKLLSSLIKCSKPKQSLNMNKRKRVQTGQ